MLPLQLRTPTLQKIEDPLFRSAGIELQILRLDQLHPLVSGNKWFKLRFWLEEALATRRPLVSRGGYWSNHLLALAAAGHACGLPTHGIVRGEEPLHLSASLEEARALGMTLHFVSRAQFKRAEWPHSDLPGNALLIPEGGAGENGVRGAATIRELIPAGFTHIACAAGTGTMAAGLLRSLQAGTLVVVSALRNYRDLEPDIRRAAGQADGRLQVLHEFHFGGFARHNPALLDHMNRFFKEHQVPTDIVYTGKLYFALTQLTGQGFFPAGSRVLMIHSGGLSGNRSLPPGTLNF